MAVGSMQGSELELTDMTTAEETTDVRPAQFKWGTRYIWGAVVGLLTLSAIVIVGWIIGCSVTAAPGPGPSFDNGTSNFIVGGEDAKEGSWPFVVSVQKSDTKRHFCGGSLINDRWILSAAHCFRGLRPKDVRIVLGRRVLMIKNGLTRAVSEIVTHPTNDLALLKLTIPVKYTTKIRRVCLAATGSVFIHGTPSWVLGWGDIGEGVPLPDPKILQQVQVPVVDNTVCIRSYPYITDRHICAGLAKGGKGSCQGDSGGPLVSEQDNDWVQSGVVNRAKGCARPNYPTVYARVDRFELWIKSITNFDLCFIQFNSKVAGAESSSTRPGLPAAVGSVPEEPNDLDLEDSEKE